MWAKVHLALILEPQDAVAHDAFGPARGDGAREMEAQVLAITADECFARDGAGERRGALSAKRRLNGFRRSQAIGTDDARLGVRERTTAERAVPRPDYVESAPPPEPEASKIRGLEVPTRV